MLPDGWESLGDIGWFDEEGYLYLADRRTDMILVGGSNVYPAEVEAALDEHPLVQSSAVIGLVDEDLGSRVHAIVQPPGGLDRGRPCGNTSGRGWWAINSPRAMSSSATTFATDAGKVRRTQLRDERMPRP